MLSLSRLAKAVYVLALTLALLLLLQPTRSQAQSFRGTPGNFFLNLVNIPGIGNLPNNGRIVSMPPPMMMLPLNNMMFGLMYMDSTGSPLALMTSMPGGGMGMGGGMMGMMGMGGGMTGSGMMGMGGGGMMGMGGGGMMGMGGGMGGGGMTGMGGGMGGMMGMGGMSMMGMGGGGMMGFAGKGMGGFNGGQAL